jgi:Domain of unknown function (DUF6431)
LLDVISFDHPDDIANGNEMETAIASGRRRNDVSVWIAYMRRALLETWQSGEPFSSAMSAPVLVTVGIDQAAVELVLIAGEIDCPNCDGILRPWGWAAMRTIRFSNGERSITPRRSRCRLCKKTHVLIPCDLLFRRKDSVDVIGAGLTLCADGMSQQELADVLDRPQSTVRDWNRRARDLAEEIRVHFTRKAVALDATVEIMPMGSAFSNAVAAISAAGRAAVLRRVAVTPWQFASLITTSLLLCNTNPPWRDP